MKLGRESLRRPSPQLAEAHRRLVVISGHETCGIIGDLADEFERRGHDVVTIAMPHRFFPRQYDYDQYDFPVSALTRRFGMRPLWRRIFQAFWEVSPEFHQRIESRLRRQVLSDADLYIRVWGHIPLDRDGLEVVKESGGRVATFFMGSDVRDYNVFVQQYGPARWEVPRDYLEVPLVEKLHAVRTHERFADAIFSVPDQMGLALRPYHHLQVPVRLTKLKYEVPGRIVPKVVHSPSVPHIKGTDVIEAALDALKAEGVEFEFVSVRNQPHEKVLEVLTDADVLVDELVAHGPGWLSFEAMGSGCAVATRYLQDSPPCFRPPVWHIDETNIVDRLRLLLTDKELRVRLAEEGRRYVEDNNQVERVVDTIIEKVEAGPTAAHDYVPSYLTTHYKPRSDEEVDEIIAANSIVSSQSWYAEYVSGLRNDRLSF